jgi:hypothetical protein
MRRTLPVALALAVSAAGAHADTGNGSFNDLFTQGHVDGELRLYDFNRWYDTPSTPDARSLSLAALINAQTGSVLGGLSFGGSFVTANMLGTKPDTLAKTDTSLMGPNSSLGAWSQAYLQYKHDWFTFKGGYQYLNTPWMGNNDSRVIPSSYNAVLVSFNPIKDWNIYAIRTFSWKSRTSQGMYQDNLYYPSKYDGDSMYGNNGSLPNTAPIANGTWAAGTTYANGGLKAEGWYYNFLRFAQMGYVNGSYTFKTGTPFDPFLALQALAQNGSGSDNILVETQTKLVGVAGDRVKSRAWGADLGTSIYDGRIDFAYNKLEGESGAVGDGALISPYTVNYGTDPLFTTSMIRGLVEIGPGHAWKGRALYNFFDKKLQVVAAYAKYVSLERGDSHDLYFDIIYNFDGALKGLQLRDRWEKSAGGIANLNPGNEAFTYNRVMISYKF